MSKPRLLLEIDDETMSYVYSGSRTYLGPWPRMFLCWCMEPRQSAGRSRVLLHAYSGRRSQGVTTPG